MSATLIAIGDHSQHIRVFATNGRAYEVLDRLMVDFGCDIPASVIRSDGEYGAVYAPPTIFPHVDDSQCTVDPSTNCCKVCGVEHGDPCPACHGRAFHSKERPGNES